MVASDKSLSESASKSSAMNLKSRASIVPVTFREVIEWSVSSDSSLPGCDSTVVTAHDVKLISVEIATSICYRILVKVYYKTKSFF